MRRTCCLLLTLILLTACARPNTQAPPALPAPSQEVDRPPVQESPATPEGPKAESILPPEDQVIMYELSDEEKRVAEFFVRDGERLTGAQNGKPYVTWFITDQGVFRQDAPGATLLRYLPPVLVSRTAWKQPGGDGSAVWFRLRSNACVPEPGNSCWELTVLNGTVRTTFQFLEGRGVVWAARENLADPADSFEKGLFQAPKTGAPDRAAILQEMPQRPTGPLPEVADVSPTEFDAAERALLARNKALLEVDLDNNGKMERIEGPLGVWTPGPLAVYRDDGPRMQLYGSVYPNRRQKLEVATVAEMDRPALILQYGHPDHWHQIIPLWLDTKGIQTIYGWQPKSDGMWTGDAQVQPDGTLVFTGLPQLMGGYHWSKRYRVKRVGIQYQPQPIDEQINAGPYPNTPDDLLTAAFVSRWWDLKADLARYIPDEKVQDAFWATKVAKPQYFPPAARTGKISFGERGDPTITAAPLEADQSTEFLTEIGHYEGSSYYAGRVQFGQAPDGRLVITQLVITKSAFCYAECTPY